MNKVCRRLRLFKNDPFGIKEKYFRWKLNCCIKEGVKIRIKALKTYLNVVTDIRIPRNNEEKEMLKFVVGKIDIIISELEKEIKYARGYIEENED